MRSAISFTSRSNRPHVFGLVSITAATSGPSFALNASRSTRPSSVPGTSSTMKPAATAVAGLVPCALAGTSTRLRLSASPRAASAALIASMPQNSPCAPALGDSATAGMPVSSMSQCASSSISSSAPWMVEIGCNGWMSAKPSNRATRSFKRGLCFIVHEPNGKRPRSMA